MNLLGYAGQSKKINVGYVEFLRVRYSKLSGYENYALRNLNSILQSEFEKELIDIDTLSNVHNSCMQVLEVLGKINSEVTSKLLRMNSLKGYSRIVYELVDAISCSSQAKVISKPGSQLTKIININVHTIKLSFNNELSNFLYIEGVFDSVFSDKIQKLLNQYQSGHMRGIEVNRISNRLYELSHLNDDCVNKRKIGNVRQAKEKFKPNILTYDAFNVKMGDPRLRLPKINSEYANKVFKLVDVHDLKHCWTLFNSKRNNNVSSIESQDKILLKVREEIHEGLTSGLHSKDYVHKLYDSYIAKDILIIDGSRNKKYKMHVMVDENIQRHVLSILENWLMNIDNRFNDNLSFMSSEFINRSNQKLSIYHGFLNRLSESNSITASTEYVNALSDIIEEIRSRRDHEIDMERLKIFSIFMRECSNLSSSYGKDYINNVIYDIPIDWLRGDTCVVLSLPNKNVVCSVLRNYIYHEIEQCYLLGQYLDSSKYATVVNILKNINVTLLHLVR